MTTGRINQVTIFKTAKSRRRTPEINSEEPLNFLAFKSIVLRYLANETKNTNAMNIRPDAPTNATALKPSDNRQNFRSHFKKMRFRESISHGH